VKSFSRLKEKKNKSPLRFQGGKKQPSKKKKRRVRINPFFRESGGTETTSREEKEKRGAGKKGEKKRKEGGKGRGKEGGGGKAGGGGEGGEWEKGRGEKIETSAHCFHPARNGQGGRKAARKLKEQTFSERKGRGDHNLLVASPRGKKRGGGRVGEAVKRGRKRGRERRSASPLSNP